MQRRSLQRFAWLFVLASLSACAPKASPHGTAVVCPDLEVSGWHWIGVVGPPGTAPPLALVSLKSGEQTIATARATIDGAFAVRGAVEGTPDHAGARVAFGTQVLGPFQPGATQALIRYTPDTRPVYEKPPGTMNFDGELASVAGSQPIASAWIFSWTSGNVRTISPTPSLDSAFRAQLPGSAGQCVSVVSLHTGGGQGGCWWPVGGGCYCHHCSAEDIGAGLCADEPDLGPPAFPCGCVDGGPEPDAGVPPPRDAGREPLTVHERGEDAGRVPPMSVPPPPERDDSIPVGAPPPGEPPDAGSDLGTDIDAWIS